MKRSFKRIRYREIFRIPEIIRIHENKEKENDKKKRKTKKIFNAIIRKEANPIQKRIKRDKTSRTVRVKKVEMKKRNGNKNKGKQKMKGKKTS